MTTANYLVEIVSDKDYTVTSEHKEIYALHCIGTNSHPVVVWPVHGNPVTFPAGSFIRGAMYAIAVKRIRFHDMDTNVGFMGYTQKF
jgi:hypothetical protein